MPKANFHKRQDPATGEIVWVKGPALYSDWDLLAVAGRMPGEHEDYVDGKWVKDGGKATRDDRERKARSMSRVELLDRLEVAETRLSAVEAQLAAITKATTS
jgi:hypothetical protein